VNRRSILLLALLSAAFATAGSQMGLTQSDLLIGTWKLNVDKSKFSPGPPPKSQTLNFQRVGQDLQNTAETVDAQGQVTKIVFMHIYDGKPHPTTGNPLFDATTYTPVDDHHVKWVRSKVDKPVQTGTNEISADGKTFTVSTEGIGANGQPISSVAVYER
jgi:hypothetical protein